MNKRMWFVAGGGVGLALLAAASYVAISLMATGSAGLGTLQLPGVGDGQNQQRGYQILPPTEVPQTLPDMVGPVVEVKDQSFIVQSHTKGTVEQNGPRTEIVIAADTKVYEDITIRAASSVVNGKLQQRVAPYAYNQIKPGDLLEVWGSLRGDRLTAEAVIVQVSSATPTP